MSDRYTVARMTHDGENFEILVKPQLAHSYRRGKTPFSSKILITDTIFTDAKKGLRVSESKLQEIFGTKDAQKIADVILKRGTLQLTTEQRKQQTEEKRRQVVSFISRQCVDPKTNLPHPPLRIEQAMKQIRYSIDPVRDVEGQAKEIIKLLLPILPLKTEKITVNISIPPEYAGKSYGTAKDFGVIRREQWQSDGSWAATLELPAGLYGVFLERLGKITRGNLEVKIV